VGGKCYLGNFNLYEFNAVIPFRHLNGGKSHNVVRGAGEPLRVSHSPPGRFQLTAKSEKVPIRRVDDFTFETARPACLDCSETISCTWNWGTASRPSGRKAGSTGNSCSCRPSMRRRTMPAWSEAPSRVKASGWHLHLGKPTHRFYDVAKETSRVSTAPRHRAEERPGGGDSVLVVTELARRVPHPDDAIRFPGFQNLLTAWSIPESACRENGSVRQFLLTTEGCISCNSLLVFAADKPIGQIPGWFSPDRPA